jgi:hypothetical protein
MKVLAPCIVANALIASCLISPFADAAESPRPNIVVIMADDK